MADDTEKAVALREADTGGAAALWQSFLAMAENKDIDAEKMRALVDLQMKLRDDARREEFQTAKARALAEMPIIEKDGRILDKAGGVRSRYSYFENLMLAVQPVLQRHGLYVAFTTRDTEDTRVKVVVMNLGHRNGYVEDFGPISVAVVAPNQTVSMTQAGSMALTTGKRNLLKAGLGLVERGDDGTAHLFGARPLTADDKAFLPTLEAARKANAAGTYDAYYQSLSAQEKGWLLSKGYHQIGGKGFREPEGIE